MTVDITITRIPPLKEPPKDRCKLCARTLGRPFAEMFLALFDNPENVLEKYEGLRICRDCFDKLKTEIGISA
jgi:hypothetical protein